MPRLVLALMVVIVELTYAATSRRQFKNDHDGKDDGEEDNAEFVYFFALIVGLPCLALGCYKALSFYEERYSDQDPTSTQVTFVEDDSDQRLLLAALARDEDALSDLGAAVVVTQGDYVPPKLEEGGDGADVEADGEEIRNGGT